MVHPHARGEDNVDGVAAVALRGSPPRTWGRPWIASGRSRTSWFTPTHVGKTQRICYMWNIYMVHPHARGEDTSAFCCL